MYGKVGLGLRKGVLSKEVSSVKVSLMYTYIHVYTGSTVHMSYVQ